jgi:D-aspartate ligase
MINRIFVLGDHIQGLGIIQIAGRMKLEVLLFNDNNMCLGRFSRYCTDFIYFSDKNMLEEKLLLMAGSVKNTLLMPTNDSLVEFVKDKYDILKKYYYLPILTAKTYTACLDKRETYKVAKKIGIPIPVTHFPVNQEDALIIAEAMHFPVLIRPAFMHRFFEKTGKKLLLCKNKDDLIKQYKFAAGMINQNEIIMQEYIESISENLYSFCSFFADNTPYGSFVVHRLRQRPIDFGISSTFVKSVANEKIERFGTQFLRGLNYEGISEVEFAFDKKDKMYKLLEINPRTWKYHVIAEKLGVCLIKMLIDYHDGKSISPTINTQEGIVWVEPFTDLLAIIETIVKRKAHINNYIFSLIRADVLSPWAIDDIIPGLIYSICLPFLYQSRR